jgi:hypothetical protein
LVQAAVGRPEFPDEVSTFGVSSLSQALLKCLESGLDWLPLAQDSDPIHLPRRLRLSGERRGEEAASDDAKERSPMHHSIT